MEKVNKQEQQQEEEEEVAQHADEEQRSRRFDETQTDEGDETSAVFRCAVARHNLSKGL